ncbi:MAG: glutamate formimidoyltransferase [Gammaproteobacteria bacterium]|nr:MAG: glutamate formimidoyltransferase [Gammaproteobacteria bacterium]TLZ09297.1 MAG: glutamate formimidoyltransferase [Gammaproteobacteria bacterium]TLZ09586.1 MAG: glutamate formimidoyltransferase [Gammaproteobacteria bacterium]TLZ11681.1 MAG: glutamate formimidoyltransferase [Gammaproteobacteria bacterium]TLZ20807.1 MAG: glutamate formimidoyltransferase [Gammaproteobacteria bacterium]
MSTLVECVPNFSEGRDKAKVDAIVAAMKMDGVYLLDCEMDADHNRCVITLVGERELIQEAAIRGVGKAAELIDLNVHQGAHPRMGAADVVPFVPIEGVSIEDCVAMARQVGAEIWKRYQIPVYLYEVAATTPERQNLETIRRGQFEGIRAEITTNPARKPDFGDPRVHPTAGATAVGARKFLIAYNVFLGTPDVQIAKSIAKAIRFSSGGLRFVKSAGFLVRGMAQVSMNLTDFEQTPIQRVFEMVKREAARYGVSPVSSEIVGLIPRRALEAAAEWFLQVENLDSSLILENRLSAVMGGKAAVGGLRAGVEPFVEQLAAPTATPGGGSASAASAAMAAALATMVASMSRGKKAYLQYERELSDAIARLGPLREELKAAIDADAESFNVVMKAYKQAKESADPHSMIDAALKQATSVPLGVAERAREIAEIVEKLRPITNPNMKSDLTTASALAHAAIEGASANVEINLESMKDAAFAADVRKRAAVLRHN